MLKNRKNSGRSFAGCVLAVLLIALVVIISVHLLLQFLNLNVFHEQHGAVYELSNRFDLDDESSVPTWLSQFLLLVIACAAGVAAWTQRLRAPRLLWGAITLIALVFSIDEVAILHEYVLEMLHTAFLGDTASNFSHNAWLVVAPFVLAGSCLLVWLMYRHFPKRTLVLLTIAGMVFVSGAMGVDIVTSSGHFSAFMSQGALVALEEGMELAGSMLALYAIVDYLERAHGHVFGGVAAQLRSLK
jgi:hypothetical protein